VVDGKSDAGKICPQERPHPEGQTARQLGEDVHRLKLLGVDVGLAGPIRFILALRSKSDVVARAALEWFLTHQVKFVVFLLSRGEREKASGQTVFGLVVDKVFAKVVNQFSVDAVSLGLSLAADGLVLPLVPVAAGQLLQRSVGMVRFGDNLVFGGLLAQDFAIALSGNNLDVLLVKVLAAKL